MIVSFLVWWKGKDVRKGIDSIARSIDADEDVSKWELPSILDGMDKKVLVDAVLNSDIANMFQLTSKEIPNEPEEIVFAGKDSIETPVGMAPRISSPKVKPNLGVSTTTSTANSATTVSSSILTQDLDNIEEARDDPNQATQMSLSSIKKQGNNSTISAFDPFDQLIRLAGAVATLGSGCSLGPEGPAVEIGAGWSRIISGIESSQKERHHLFLAGTAAGVAAGFNAPISGVFFAIECGNRYLSKNTVKLDEDAPDGPRADIAAIVIAAALADIAVGFGLNENAALSVQGNGYAMVSPLFELPLYVGLGLLCGAVSVAFTKSRDFFTETFTTKVEGRPSLSMIPRHLHPILGGALCGIISVFLPQTLFVGYTTLDQLIAGKLQFEFPLLLELLGSKLLLSAFSLGSGLIGGVFAPSLFFGATLGTAYHTVLASLIDSLHYVTNHVPALHAFDPEGKYFSLANAPAYATVGAAATLGALFRAPLTSSMLMFELTQNHDIVLPVLVSTGIAGLFAELLSQSRRLW